MEKRNKQTNSTGGPRRPPMAMYANVLFSYFNLTFFFLSFLNEQLTRRINIYK